MFITAGASMSGIDDDVADLAAGVSRGRAQQLATAVTDPRTTPRDPPQVQRGRRLTLPWRGRAVLPQPDPPGR